MAHASRHIAEKRSLYLQKIRDFFQAQGFLEVETPIMVGIPGMEPHLTPFETTLTTPHGETRPMYLSTSPELQMKKLLGKGFENIYTITKTFRNGELGGPLHNPEFTMLEWYRTKSDYRDLMTDCEKLVHALFPGETLTWQGRTIDLVPPWQRISTRELFLTHCKIDLAAHPTTESFAHAAAHLDTHGCDTWDDIFFKLFLNHIEPHLGDHPVFIYDYPATQAALAKKSTENPFFAERTELYIAGLELANGFSELTDSAEQRTRLTEEQKLRKKLGKTAFDIDEEFLAHLESITHPTAGIALGIDRLLMLLMDVVHIDDTLLFPINTA